jgi:hypothetical protein
MCSGGQREERVYLEWMEQEGGGGLLLAFGGLLGVKRGIEGRREADSHSWLDRERGSGREKREKMVDERLVHTRRCRGSRGKQGRKAFHTWRLSWRRERGVDGERLSDLRVFILSLCISSTFPR